MSTSNNDDARNDSELANQDDDGMQADPAASALIGTNIIGLNTASFPGGIVAPAGELAAAQSANENNGGANVDAPDQGGSAPQRSGDGSVSPEQGELEAGELNG